MCLLTYEGEDYIMPNLRFARSVCVELGISFKRIVML